MNKSCIYGLIITFIWFIIMVTIFINKTSIDNENISNLGEFLGGFLSPVAFLWLILGYVQQGHELKQNTIAITQQKDEYIKSVKLSAYIAMMEYETREVDFLNKLGKDFENGAKKARDRGKSYKKEIEKLLNEIKNIEQ